VEKSSVKDAVYAKITEIERMREAEARAVLANLRQGLGKHIGEADLSFVLSNLGDFADGRDDELKVIYAVMTIFAKHQQGTPIGTKSMYDKNTPFCKSLQQNDNYSKDEAGKSFRKRFQVMLTSGTREELLRHIRSLVALQKGIGFDYPRLAADIYRFGFDENRDDIRLKWGKEFYITKKSEEKDNG
jgi:CRISPR type I-E-associated protein CasB/Cse2